MNETTIFIEFNSYSTVPRAAGCHGAHLPSHINFIFTFLLPYLPTYALLCLDNLLRFKLALCVQYIILYQSLVHI